MILVWLIVIPLVCGALGWALGRRAPAWSRGLALVAMAADLALAISLWPGYVASLSDVNGPRFPKEILSSHWMAEVDWAWIPALGVRFHLAIDGLSLVMVTLAALLGLVAVAASWSGIKERVGFFHMNLMFVLAGIMGVFLAVDLFLFYFFWELMLIPMYFLIDIWGHERRHYAAVKFFLFTQASGLLMLVAILALYFIHHSATGQYTFDYTRLVGTHLDPTTATLLMLGFAAAFLVKLPAVPFHTWLPDAHTEAPTAGSVILAGLLLKTGAYGFLKFVLPLFPEAAHQWAPVFMTLGVVGIVYGAVLAFAQTDLKRLVAYTSVSHLGFVLLGIFAWNPLGQLGAVMQMISHGLSTGGLFVLVGALQDRIGTRDMGRMGGLWTTMPRMGGVAMVLTMASLGLPGLGNFVGEFLVLLGAYKVSVPLAVIATVGLVFATVYSLWMMYQVFHGRPKGTVPFSGFSEKGTVPLSFETKGAVPISQKREMGTAPSDLGLREMAIFIVLILAIVWLGLFPHLVLYVVWGG
jgi:NADH-quinone oxidoreductase subunit M